MNNEYNEYKNEWLMGFYTRAPSNRKKGNILWNLYLN